MLTRDMLEVDIEVVDGKTVLVTVDSRLAEVVWRGDTDTDDSGGSALRELPLPSSTGLVDTTPTELLVVPMLASDKILLVTEPKIIVEVAVLNIVSSAGLGSKAE